MPESGFGIDHLPYGVYSTEGAAPRVGVRYGDAVVDAATVTGRAELAEPALNAFMALGPAAWAETRAVLTQRVADADAVPLDQVALHLPFRVGDYVDFYASLDHASNVGRIFRPDQEPLLPNWRHLPVGYHGRGGTVVVSGTPVVRPCGQRKAPSDEAPTYGPSRRLDIEAELGFVIGVGSGLGDRISVDAFADHVFGVVGLNDWSARDIQAWEYVPLGPFLGKSFATSLAAWITPLDALEGARTRTLQDPEPLPHLRETGSHGLRLDLEVTVNGQVVSRPAFGDMYWSYAQMLAHLTSNGSAVRPGDVFASGTVSGPERDRRGCLLELSWNGSEPIELGDGTTRTWLEDGDDVVVTARAGDISLGEVGGRIVREYV